MCGVNSLSHRGGLSDIVVNIDSWVYFMVNVVFSTQLTPFIWKL